MREENIKQVDRIMTALTQVIDPELQVDVVNLGLIYGIDIEEEKATIKMTLTIMGCPLSDYLQNSIQKAVLQVDGINECEIQLVWYPVWSPERMSRAAKEQLGMQEKKKLNRKIRIRSSTLICQLRRWQINIPILSKLCMIAALPGLRFQACLIL